MKRAGILGIILCVVLNYASLLNIKGLDTKRESYSIKVQNHTIGQGTHCRGFIEKDGRAYIYLDKRYYDYSYDTGYINLSNGESGYLENADNIKSIAFAQRIPYILKNDGSVWQFGVNMNSRSDRIKASFTPTNILNDVKSIGYSHEKEFFYAIKSNGDLYVWGYNEYQILSNQYESGQYIMKPVLVEQGIADAYILDGVMFVLTRDGVLKQRESYYFEEKVIKTNVKQIFNNNTFITQDNNFWGHSLTAYSEESFENPRQIDSDVKYSWGDRGYIVYVTNENEWKYMGAYDVRLKINHNQINGFGQFIFGLFNQAIPDGDSRLGYISSSGDTMGTYVKKPSVINDVQFDQFYGKRDNEHWFLATQGSNVYNYGFLSFEVLLSDEYIGLTDFEYSFSELELSENEIFTMYPESLTNSIDEIFSFVLEHQLKVANRKSTHQDDLLVAIKNNLNLNNNIKIILESLVSLKDKNYIFDKYSKDILLELMLQCSQSDETYKMFKLEQEGSTFAKESFSSFKKIFSKTTNIDKQKLLIKYYFDIKDEETTEKLLKQYAEINKKISKTLKLSNHALDVFDLIVFTEKLNMLSKDVLSEFKKIFSETCFENAMNDIYNSNKNIESNIKYLLTEKGLNKVLEIANDFISDKFEDVLFNFIDGRFASTDASLTMFIAKKSLKYIGDKIDAPTLDETMKSIIAPSLSLVAYQRMSFMRLQFKLRKNDETESEIKDIDEYIQRYRIVYNAMLYSTKMTNETTKKLGTESDRLISGNIDTLLEECNYKEYLNNCVLTLQSGAYPFKISIEDNEVYIDGIEDAVLRSKSTFNLLNDDSDKYKINANSVYLFIPDTIYGIPVVGIRKNALKGDYQFVFLGQNIRVIENNAFSNMPNLKLVKTGELLEEVGDDIFPNSSVAVITSSEKLTDKYLNLVNLESSSKGVDNIEIIEAPTNEYIPGEDFISQGIKIQITDVNGNISILDSGWLETVIYDTDTQIARLDIFYGGQSASTYLKKKDKLVEYKVFYEDTSGNFLCDPIVLNSNCSSEVIVQPLKINNYTCINNDYIIYLNKGEREYHCVYRRNIDLMKSIYQLQLGEELLINVISQDGLKYQIENEEILKYDDGKFIAISEGMTELKLENLNGDFVNVIVFVEQPPINKIRVEPPYKLVYIEGEDIDLTGGIIDIIYSNGYITKKNLNMSTISNFDKSRVGEQSIKVNYMGFESEFKIIIKEKEITKIEINSNPLKLNYCRGDELDLTGGKLKIIYNNGEQNIVNLTMNMIQSVNMNEIGKKNINVIYNGFSTTFEIEIRNKDISEITSRLGDVNRDGVVNTLDSQMILQALIGLLTLDEEQMILADINQDGNINTLDSQIALQKAIGLIE